ncbi:FAD/NAD(P)-binding protein [Hutsoniella sourekii]
MIKVAIIGMGISGSAVLDTYAHSLSATQVSHYLIDCYDQADSWGRGLPFRADDCGVLVNTRAETISYSYYQPGDFANWLHNQGVDQSYSSRQAYGDYLRGYTYQAASRVQARIINHWVDRLDYLENTQQWQVHPGGRIYDRIHLCVGRTAYQDPYQLQGKPTYIHQPYPLDQELKSINQGSRLGILGSNLTAIDITKYLAKQKGAHKIYLLSRQGQVPVADVLQKSSLSFYHLTIDRVRERIKLDKGLVFRELDHLIQAEFQAHGINWDHYQSTRLEPGLASLRGSLDHPEEVATAELIFLQLTRLLNLYWSQMTSQDQDLFLAKYHRASQLTKAKIPPESAEVLLDLANSGQLEVLAGIYDIRPLYPGFLINQSLKLHYLINGMGLDPAIQNQPLLAQLASQEIIESDPRWGIKVEAKTSQIKSPRWGTLANATAHGLLVEGTIYQANSIYIIQAQVARTLKHLF